MADLGGGNSNNSVSNNNSSNSSNGGGGLGVVGRLSLGAAKTRPLGQVKTETLHFQTTAASVPAGISSAAAVVGSGGTLIGGGGGGAAPVPRPSPFLPVPVPNPTATPAAASSAIAAAYPELRRGAGCEDQGILLRASIKSMREIRENLRQAALLNIVAAANSDGGPSYHHPLPHHYHQQQRQQHHHHHHSKQQQQQQLSEGPPPPSAPELRLHFLDTSQLPPPHHHFHHHHHHHQQQLQHHQHQQQRKHQTSPLTLHMTTNGTSPFQQSPEAVGGGGGRSAGSGTYHHSSLKKEGGDTSPLPHTLVANLLSPRMRTISIPRPGPRIGDLSGPFIHKSLTQAKECLSRVGEMVRSRTEGALQLNDSGGGKATAVTNEEGVVPCMGHTAVSEKLEEPYPDQSPTVPALVQLLDTPVNGDASKSTSAAEPPPPPPSKAGSASSRDVSNTLPPPPQSASSSSSSRRTLADARSAGSRKTRGSVSEDRSGGSSAHHHHHHHRALSVRRHLSPGKKRELVKRLTEMAKCEAVDMSNPMGTQEEKNNSHHHENRFRPPMIILSQQRQEIRCPAEEESSSSMAAVQFSGVSEAESRGDLGGSGMHRAKSLTSLNHTHSYPAASSRETQHQEGPSTERVPGRLYRANSGSMPDLVMEGGPPSFSYNQRDMKRSDSSDWTTAASAGQTFAEGIVGKTLLKEKEVGNTRGLVAESPRPLLLLPSTPKNRARRSTRPSSRRSTLGLRDRGPPLETTPTGATTATTTTTTTSVLSLNPSSQNRLRSSHGGVVPQTPDPTPPASQQNLPVLTITGLNRERPPPGTPSANSRANRELKPTSRAEVAGSLQFYQQLDDQCEKLQRQLNITLNMPPRRVPHWQSGTIPPTSSIPMNRTGFSPYPYHHHTSMFLTDGPEDTDAAGNTTTHFHHHHDPSNPVPPLSDVEEDSHGNTNATRTDSATHPPHPHGEDVNLYPGRTGHGHQNYYYSEGSASSLKNNRKAGSCSGPPQSEAADPVLQSKKEPRYQGFSSRVPESEVRSQFHYVTPGSVAAESRESESTAAATAEEEREMKYRVLKALDQDVYYDFQHRKYRNTPGSTPLVRCNNEEDRPRVHFYKVKLNGET